MIHRNVKTAVHDHTRARFGLETFFFTLVLAVLGQLLFVADADAAIAYVQGNSVNATSAATLSVSFTGAQSNGNLIVVAIGFNTPSASVTSVSDSSGNTYALALSTLSNPLLGGRQSTYFAKNIAAAGANTVTVVLSTTVQRPSVRVMEYSGVDTTNPLDVAAGNVNAGTISTVTLSTTIANDLLIATNYAVVTGTAGASPTASGDAAYVQRMITTGGEIVEDLVVSSTGSYTASATLSGPSNWLMHLVGFKAADGDNQAPSVPTGLAATAVSNTQIHLSWNASTDNVGLAGYRIERCRMGSTCFGYTEVAATTGTTFDDTSVSGSSTYFYRVRARDVTTNLSGFADPVSATTAASTDTQAPTAPLGLSVATASSSQIGLVWEASSDDVGVSGYNVERCQGIGCVNFSPIGTSPGVSYIDTGLIAATVYNYRVTARDAANNASAYSTSATATTSPASGVSANITYGYDALNRLVQVASPIYNVVQSYTYDASGNIVSVTGAVLTRAAVSGLSTTQGAVGTQLTIFGSSFSTTPALNTVTFNGVAATVVSASATQLVVIVPGGATTGPVRVTVGSFPAAGSVAFTVTSTGAPTISGFSPSAGFPGDPVTITGTNFDANAQNNRIRFNAGLAQTTSATAISLGTVVPGNGGSGKLQVTTPRGVAVSPSDFIVVPVGYLASNIGPTGRVTADASPITVSFPAANKVGIELFDGKIGELLTLAVTNTSFATCALKIYAPSGVLLASGSVTANGQAVQLPKLPSTGTYTVLIDPGNSTGSLTLSLVSPLAGTLSIDGAPASLSFVPPGRRAVLSFAGTQNAYVALVLSSVTLTGGTASILNPDGSTLISTTFGPSGSSLQPLLPVTGTYKVLIEPMGSISGSTTASLVSSAVPILSASGSYTELPLSSQASATLQFRATAGQYLSLAVHASSPTVPYSSVSGATITITGPDGATLQTGVLTPTFVSGSGYTGGATLNFVAPSGGTYSVTVQRSGGSGSLWATLSTPVTGSLPINSAPLNSAVNRMGQGWLYTFSGSAGQTPSIGVSESISGIAGATITVLRPDGSVLATGMLTTIQQPIQGYAGSATINLGVLAVSGTYSVLVQQLPDHADTGTLTFTLSTPVTGTLTAGTAVNGAATVRGQGWLYTFSGSAGQAPSIAVSESVSGIAGATITVLRPDGSVLATGMLTTIQQPIQGYAGSATINLGFVAVSGTYSVLVQQLPDHADIGTLTFTLSTPITGTLTAGTAVNGAATVRGQGWLYTFSGSAGQAPSIAVSESVSGIAGATVTVLRPDGSVLATGTLTTIQQPIQGYAGSATINLGFVAVSGTYSVLVQQLPDHADIGTLTFTLSTPITGTLTAGTAVNGAATVRGQGWLYTFSGSAGQAPSIAVSESVSGIAGATITVLRPDGSVIATGTLTATQQPVQGYSGSTTINVGVLVVSGTYSVLVQQLPDQASTGTLRFTLSVL